MFHGLRGGTGTLIDALVEQLGDRGAVLETNTSVESLEALDADRLVLTTPAATSARMLAGTSATSVELLGSIETVSVVLVTLVYDRLDLPDGASGYLVPRDSGQFLAAVSWGSTKWAHWDDGRHSVLRASAGHRDDQRVCEMTDEEIVAGMLADIATTSGLDTAPVATRVSRWNDGFHQYDVGHLDLVDRIDEALGHDTDGRIRVAGSAYRGVGIPACIRQGRAAVVD